MKKVNCILLIDDNVHDNFFHSIVIKEADAAKQIKTALNGEEALDYLEKAIDGHDGYILPEIIFLDINMPGMNGFEFIEKARKMNLVINNKPIAIIMLTSSLNPNDLQTAKEKFPVEIKEFKNKPLTHKMLKDVINCLQ